MALSYIINIDFPLTIKTYSITFLQQQNKKTFANTTMLAYRSCNFSKHSRAQRSVIIKKLINRTAAVAVERMSPSEHSPSPRQRADRYRYGPVHRWGVPRWTDADTRQ